MHYCSHCFSSALLGYCSITQIQSLSDYRKKYDEGKVNSTVPKSVADMWESLSTEVRAALIASEMKATDAYIAKSSLTRSGSNTPTILSRSSSDALFEQNSSIDSSKDNEVEVKHEKCPVSGATVTLSPVERAPKNVFAFTKTHFSEKSEVTKTSTATVTTTTKVVSTSRGWRNIFSLPISYDVNMVAHGTLFDRINSQLLDATGVHPEGYNTRFAVIDAEVDTLHGEQIRNYFACKGIELTTCVINGGEADKRPKVSLSDQLWKPLVMVICYENTFFFYSMSNTFDPSHSSN